MHGGDRHQTESEVDFEERDFDPSERARLRRQMREWDRCHWAWKLFVRFVAYSTAVIGSLYIMRDFLLRIGKAFFGISN